jgi:phosphotransferase system  glucose/maltose/N-acetylglucosamine-specific IIC component
MISRQNGIIITAIVAVLFGCAGIATGIAGLLGIPGSTVPYEITGWVWLAANSCTALGFISLPVIFYFVFVANNKEEPASPERQD